MFVFLTRTSSVCSPFPFDAQELRTPSNLSEGSHKTRRHPLVPIAIIKSEYE